MTHKPPRSYKLPKNWRDRPDAPPPGVELPPEAMELIEAQYLAANSPAPEPLPPLAPDAFPRDYKPAPPVPTTPLLADVIQQSCQNSFLAFCCLVMPDFLPTKVHTYLANQLQQVYEDVKAGKDPRVMVEIQPQIGKSTLTSVLFPAWVLGKESWPIICASYGSGLAERNSYMCREIIDSAAYRIVFPTVKLRSDSTSKEFWRTTTDGSYKAIGVGGGLTGFSGKLLLCLDGDSVISTDKGNLKIADIVDQKLPVTVKSFNHITGEVEYKEIEEYEKNPGKDLLEFTLDDGTVFSCTEDHPVYVDGVGYVLAKELSTGEVTLVLP